MIVQVQTLNQNTGNWEYSVKGCVEFINVSFIKRITPVKTAYLVYMEGHTITIDRESLDKILEIGVKNDGMG